jgi:hypothetical protein
MKILGKIFLVLVICMLGMLGLGAGFCGVMGTFGAFGGMNSASIFLGLIGIGVAVACFFAVRAIMRVLTRVEDGE